MKITIIYDNTVFRKDLRADWGFAALVETYGKKILFDTGASGSILLANMEKLGYDPAAMGKGENPGTEEIPVVILVAGKSDIGIFPQAQKQETGGIMIPGFPFPTIFTAQMGDYVAFKYDLTKRTLFDFSVNFP